MERKVKKGVLLVNLGTPDSPKVFDVFRYLTEFLTDARIISLPWLKRQLLVRGVIIPARVNASAKLYQEIWQKEGSPLLIHSYAAAKALSELLGEEYSVEVAMRYQNPSIQAGLEKLREASVESILVLPMFPQYASATTGSVHQKVMEVVKDWEVIPSMVFLNSYYDHPGLISAFCEQAKKYPLHSYDQILLSFHGLPEAQIRKVCSQTQSCSMRNCSVSVESCFKTNSCYKFQCHATAELIASQLNLSNEQYTICFQSRLGKDPWISPYTSEILQTGAKKGWKRVLVICPSFVTDCLETLSEIGKEYSQEFIHAGGEKLDLVEGLNQHPTWINTLKNLVMGKFSCLEEKKDNSICEKDDRKR